MGTLSLTALALMVAIGVFYAAQRKARLRSENPQAKRLERIALAGAALFGLGVGTALFAIRMVWDEKVRTALLFTGASFVGIGVIVLIAARPPRH